MKSRTRVQGITLIVALLLLVGCSSATLESPLSPLPTPTTEALTTSSESTSQPPAVLVEGLPFSLDEPLKAGDSEVSGTGPIGVPIVISDLTYVGEVLGRGTVDSDGRFDIQVAPPLVLNHRIGILLDGESTEFEFTQEVLDQLEAFKGEETILLPRIGIVYGAASVVP